VPLSRRNVAPNDQHHAAVAFYLDLCGAFVVPAAKHETHHYLPAASLTTEERRAQQSALDDSKCQSRG